MGIDMKFKVVEKFVSINGEGYKAGQLAVFIRFLGCNLRCSYCDTSWANEKDAPFVYMTENEIYEYIQKTNVKNVTLTGGEPLFRDGMDVLLDKLHEDAGLFVEIETNGSVYIADYRRDDSFPSFTMDYKLPESGMENKMNHDNMKYLTQTDTVKFVVGSDGDLSRAKQVIEEYGLTGKCHVYFSPVFGKIEPERIVNFMIENNLNGVNMQLQMHKFIWDPNKRGV